MLKNNRERVLSALMSCSSIAEAARKTGIGERTIRRYMVDKDFRLEYQRRKLQVVSEATGYLQQSYSAAITALRDIVESSEATEGARISAARTLLEYGLRFTEITDVLTRLDAVEREIGSN